MQTQPNNQRVTQASSDNAVTAVTDRAPSPAGEDSPRISEARQRPPKPEGQDRHDLLKLLVKVKQTWVDGKLKASLHNEILIPLRMKIQMGTVEDPWGQEFELPDRTFPKEEKIGDIFHKASNFLLILGAPGSGKTIALLELARDLIARAELNPYEPIPVVFHLSSWTDKAESLVDWLVAELRSKYQIPEKTGRRWLQKHRIMPLLDGLDEIKPNNRDGCVKAINEFTQGAGLTGLAVCSRRGEYEKLPTRLKLNEGILLLPLTTEQINEYLDAAGTELRALRTALQIDEGLQSLAQSPLMLSVMRSAYKDMSVEQLTSKILKASDRRQHLFDTYINRMFELFELRSGGEQPYTSDQAIGWLSWLARKMTQHSQSIFLIEELQPSWLSTDRQFWYYRLSCHLASGLFFGLSTALITLGFTGLSRRALIYVLSCFAFGSLGVPYLVIVKSLLNDGSSPTAVSIRNLTDYLAMAKSLLRGGPKVSVVDSAARILTSPASYIHTSEHLGWKWKDMIKPGVAGLKIGLVFGVFGGLFEMIGLIQGELSLKEVGYHSLSDIMLGGILFMGLLGLFLGVSSSISTEKTTPNEGISLSLKNACSLGMTSAVIIGIVVFMYYAKPGTNFVAWDRELLDRLGKYKYGLFQAMVAGTFFGQTVAMIPVCLQRSRP